jgi:RNA recognition motif-containing protein
VIRDYKTNDSLQYAFIEFEKEDDCIMAYSKMDGVLVDERRIKVDFSNSVAKLWNQHRRNKLRDEARDIMQDEQKNKDTIYKMNPFAQK